MAGLLAIADVFSAPTPHCPKNQRPSFVYRTLVQHRYQRCTRRDRGVIRRYLQAATGYSSSQLSRHIGAYKQGRKLCRARQRRTFPARFTARDRELLAETDNLHRRLNGAATRKICRAMARQGDRRFDRLATISVSHLYNLRRGERYRERAITIERTKPVQVAIGERCKPDPNEQPGFLRVDTVHQGDRGGEKGVYHVNLVDEVTQWQVVLAVEGISETFLLPVLKEALRLFPFRIRNFHSDNGSEFINKQVAGLLQALLVRQTKSRPRHSNDNGLVESKNGAIIRKHMGYVHIPGTWAPRINTFYRAQFIPYINFHRPCAFPTVEERPDGKRIVRYKPDDYRTPCEKFLALKHPSRHLRHGMTLRQLEEMATEHTSNEVAKTMQEAKRKLLQLILDFSDGPPPSFLS